MTGFWLPTATADPPWWLPTETADPAWWLWTGETVEVPDPPAPPPPVPSLPPARLIYTSPHGAGQLVLGGPDGLGPLPADLTGLSAPPAEMVVESAPGQWGGTVTGVRVEPRMLTCAPVFEGDGEDSRYLVHRQLSALMSVWPSQSATLPPLGMLRLEYGDGHIRQLPALGTVRPGSDRWIGDRWFQVELDWLAPDPRWRTPGLRHVELRPPVDGGLAGPIAGPIWSLGGGGARDVDHQGTAPAPVLVRFHGPSTGASVVLDGGPRVALKASTVLEAGEEVRVSTSLVGREVTFRADGTVTPAAHLVDWSATTLWQLPPGSHRLEHQAEAIDGGWAVVSWETHWAGI